MPRRLRTLFILLLALLLPVRMFAGIALEPTGHAEPPAHSLSSLDCCPDQGNAHTHSGGGKHGVCDHAACYLSCALPLPPSLSVLLSPVRLPWPVPVADALSARIPDLPHPPPRLVNL